MNVIQKIILMCYQHFIWDNLMFSSLKSMILILQGIWRPYQVKTWKNISRKWMMKLRVLLEDFHGRLYQESNFLITMCFQEHNLSSAIGNLFGRTLNPRRGIVWEGVFIRDFSWAFEIVLYSDPMGHSEVSVGFEVYSSFA